VELIGGDLINIQLGFSLLNEQWVKRGLSQGNLSKMNTLKTFQFNTTGSKARFELSRTELKLFINQELVAETKDLSLLGDFTNARFTVNTLSAGTQIKINSIMGK